MSSVVFDSDNTYQYLKNILLDEFGVVLGEDNEQKITDKLYSVMSDNGIDTMPSLTDSLQSENSSGLRTEVLQAITEHNINWFNYPEIMSVFGNYILPNIDHRKAGSYRIWVIGCGKGQTAFSLAIEADKYNKKENVDLSIEILATDSSEVTIQDAEKARFKESFLNGLNDLDKKQYLSHQSEDWVVNDSIRSMVKFSTENLLNINNNDLDGFDLILCPEILVYYTVSVKTLVLENLAQRLNSSGILIAGEHETILPFCRQFTLVDHDSGKFYRKQN